MDEALVAAARQGVIDLRELGDAAHAAGRRLHDALLEAQAAEHTAGLGPTLTPEGKALARRWGMSSSRRSER